MKKNSQFASKFKDRSPNLTQTLPDISQMTLNS